VSLSRKCSRAGCSSGAVATLTYGYADQTAVVGPLATYAEPHTYDLCVEHAEGLTVPRGWDVVRLSGEYLVPQPGHDDLLAVANAVREAGPAVEWPGARPEPPQETPPALVPGGAGARGGQPDRPAPRRPAIAEVLAPESARKGHLRVLRDL
jgi:hypothetical protein